MHFKFSQHSKLNTLLTIQNTPTATLFTINVLSNRKPLRNEVLKKLTKRHLQYKLSKNVYSFVFFNPHIIYVFFGMGCSGLPGEFTLPILIPLCRRAIPLCPP